MTNKLRFLALRSRIFKLIEAEIAEDDYCKSYEGSLEVTTQFPNFFEDNDAERDADYFCITLHCYVLGNSRHHYFTGKTMEEALGKLEAAIEQWEKKAIKKPSEEQLYSSEG